MTRPYAPTLLLTLATACGTSDPATDAAPFRDAGEDDGRERSIARQPTGTTCPPGSTLTWSTFGQPFFAEYCTRCHASSLSGSARRGAPDGYDWDRLDAVRLGAWRIDEAAGGAPTFVNVFMPLQLPAGPSPTNAERDRLAEWLACGAPE